MLISMLYSPNDAMHLMKLYTTRDRSEPSVQLFERRAGGVVHSESSCELSLKASFRHQINGKAGAIQNALHPPAMLKYTIIKPMIPARGPQTKAGRCTLYCIVLYCIVLYWQV